jgi:G3E family GTPase
VTVFSGFLGAGKTTILLNLVSQLAGSGLTFAWLKNEYGNVEVDSRLARESSIDVAEVLNGCVCCTAVGKLGPAISELLERFKPERILLETSGSSHPAPLAWELRRLAEGGLPIVLDALICVIDVENFKGYEDRSVTAKMQTRYTDLILLNKWEGVSEQHLDQVLDAVCELNPETPKIKTQRGKVDQQLLIGLDSKLWAHMQAKQAEGEAAPEQPSHDDSDVFVLDLVLPASTTIVPWSRWESMLAALPKDSVWRVKGVILLPQPQPRDENLPTLPTAASDPVVSASSSNHANDCICCTAAAATSSAPAASSAVATFPYILNWAFGRTSLRPLRSERYTGPTRVSYMGDRDIGVCRADIAQRLQVDLSAINLLAHR